MWGFQKKNKEEIVMKTKEQIETMIESIKKAEFVGENKHTGLSKITEKGDNWIECLEWVIEDE